MRRTDILRRRSYSSMREFVAYCDDGPTETSREHPASRQYDKASSLY